MVGFIIIAAIVLSTVVIAILRKPGGLFEPPYRKAGRYGEDVVSDVIKSVLCDDDNFFRNVSVSFEDKETEMDNVVVNRYGVFIIEVKNYSGVLYGDENDYEWSKHKTTESGSTYIKTVKNPIRQVKRQTYILAKYLDHYGCRVWVEGRVFLLNGNSPVESQYVLSNANEIDRTIHTPGRKRLNAKTVDKICGLLN